MKKTSLLRAAALASVLSFTAHTSQAASFGFETQAELTDSFDVTGSGFTSTAAIGVNGTAGLTIEGDSSAIYKTESYDFTTPGTSFTLSMFFRPTNSGANTALFLGAATSTTASLGGGANSGVFGFRLSHQSAIPGDYKIQQRGEGGQTTESPAFSLSTANFYKFTLTIQRGALNTLTATTSVDDFGANGISTPTNVTTFTPGAGFTVSNALYTDTTIFGGFRALPNNGVEHLDNFSVIGPVPEPGTTMLVGFAALGFLAIRRRRSHN